jgi:hypothetical protein
MKHIRTIAIALVVLLVLVYGAAVTAVLPKTNIPVLAHDVAAGTKIVAADVTSISWPANGTGGIITSASSVAGLVAAVSVKAGEPLTSSEFVGAQTSGQTVGHFPWANAEDAGKLPVPFPVTPNQMGGTISSGDYVDIVTGDPEPARILIQRVHVIEADDARGLPIVPNSVTAAGVAPAVPVKLVLSLSADQYPALFPLPPKWADLRFLYVTVSTPCIPGIPSGAAGSDNCSASLPTVTTAPGATPTPTSPAFSVATPTPIPTPTPSSAATPSPAASASTR